MLSIKVGGQRLSTIGANGPVTVEYGIHGLESASWEMNPGIAHPALRGMSFVQVYDGGFPIGDAILQEPGADGTYAARGIWRMCESALCIDVGGELTTVPDDAIAGALARGEISFGAAASISTTAWSTEPQPDLTLAQLLSGWANEAGLRWFVDTAATGIQVSADPTTPRWLVPHAVYGRGLAPAEDGFYTHLIGAFMDSPSTYAQATVGSDEAADAFGRRTGLVDLSPKGVITLAEAEAVLTGMFLLSGARMGWAEALELGYGQITNSGGRPAALTQIRDGQMVRLAGTVDTSRANRMPAYTDIVIGATKHTEGSGSITITPVGYAPRSLSDILTIAVDDS